ncbi:hypothetical protein BDR26DRAFT_1009886 [Obelidium mucronatum]|nr:hypothetical protein BDR26DRAFT_1009886 [Obelidium mucronatum]
MSSAPPPADLRVADLIQHDAVGKHVTLVGFPYDTGCVRNGGRPGARDGPAAFMRLVVERRTGTAANPEHGVALAGLGIGSVGSVAAGLSLEDAHAALAATVARVLGAGSVAFVVGGGNDQSFANADALLVSAHGRDCGVINIDAHLDVRPQTPAGLEHSGSPFRRLLEDPRFAAAQARDRKPRFVEFAAQGSQCAQSHADFVRDHGGEIVWLKDIHAASSAKDAFVATLDRMGGEKLFVSFDLDSVNGADAPGVSCPSPIGLSARDALEICFESGRNPRVALFDLSELNPQVEEYRSARLTAMMFHYFLMGLAKRLESS